MVRHFPIAAAIILLFSAVSCEASAAGSLLQAQPKNATPAPSQQRPAQPAASPGKIVTVAPATEGQMAVTLEYTGTLESPNQVSILPQASGRLDQVMVAVGDRVKQGDVIAVLQQDSLQLGLQQARANLAAAQAKLATTRAGGRSESVAGAQAALDAARIKLAQLRNPSPADLQSAQTALDQANANLTSAQAKLAQLQAGPLAADVVSAQSAVDQATANLTSATAKLEQVKAGPTLTDQAAAKGALDSAQANLKSARAKLDQLKAGPLQSDLVAAQATVDQAKSAMVSAEDRYQMVENGDLKETGATSNSAVRDAYDAAKSNYDAALEKLNQLMNGPQAADLQTAQSAVDSAQAAFNAANAKVEDLKRGPLETDIASGQAAVDSARAAVTSAQAKAEQVKAGATDSDMVGAQSAVDVASAALASAQAKFDQMQNPAPNDVRLAETAVRQAEQTLLLQREPYTAQDVEAAMATVEQMQASVGVAELQLSAATLVAPFDGVVAQRLVSPGALVSPSTPIATLYGDDLDILVSFDESQLSMVRPGLGVRLSSGAYPGQSFPASIASIYPSADPKTHTFVMRVVPQDSDGKLRSGMFVSVVIAADPRNNAVQVPISAIGQSNGNPVVFVVVDGKAQMRPVVQGVASGDRVELLSGVTAGEMVVVSGNTGLNDGDAVRPIQPSPSPASTGQPSPARRQPGQSATPVAPAAPAKNQ